MKRILFYSENFCGENTKGGLEVATCRIARALRDKGGAEVFNAFRSKWDGQDKSVYSDVIKLGKSNASFVRSLSDFIDDNKIDIVVNMSRFFRHKHIVRGAHKSHRNPKVIFMQHFAPGSEMKKPRFSSGFHLLKLNPFNPLYWLRATVYPLLKLHRNLRYGKVYRSTYENSEKVVLLSKGYIKDYAGIAGLSENSKFVSIPNIFDDCVSEKGTENKETIPQKFSQKRVLILSRMDEIQKRMSLALEIWKKIEEDLDLSAWHLDIVGSGHNVDIVKRLIKKLGLKRATYHGWKPREPYLEKSAIMISTSAYEGLPLALLEAQAYGVVPIAFNSYASLEDVVENFYNGVVVDNFGDVSDFAEKLKDLMNDEAYRNELSLNAVKSSNRFSSEKIVEKWIKLLSEL